MDRNRRDFTCRELAELAGVNPSRIRQILLAKNSPLAAGAHKRGPAWIIPGYVARAWLDARAMRGTRRQAAGAGRQDDGR